MTETQTSQETAPWPPRPERKRRSAERGRNLRLRNALNVIFILAALVSMAGIFLTERAGGDLTPWYVAALLAVLVKMVEVALRLPSMKR